MLNQKELAAYFRENYRTRCFRLETHQHLDIESDREDYQRYFAGEPEPPRPWLETLRRYAAEGKQRDRVHVVDEPLSDYLRFCIEWGYLGNAEAGERIRIVEKESGPDLGGQDFWIVEDEILLMYYDGDGRFVGAEPLDDPAEVRRLRKVARTAWDAGIDVIDWWREHPQYWRDNRVPTPRREDDTQSVAADHSPREGATRAS